jgi:hypothetical protein
VAPPSLLFVDVIHVTYPRYGLQGGQKLAVFDVIPGPYPKTMTIIAWGTE